MPRCWRHPVRHESRPGEARRKAPAVSSLEVAYSGECVCRLSHSPRRTDDTSHSPQVRGAQGLCRMPREELAPGYQALYPSGPERTRRTRMGECDGVQQRVPDWGYSEQVARLDNSWAGRASFPWSCGSWDRPVAIRPFEEEVMRRQFRA